jgi:hypothetical protein
MNLIADRWISKSGARYYFQARQDSRGNLVCATWRHGESEQLAAYGNLNEARALETAFALLDDWRARIVSAP